MILGYIKHILGYYRRLRHYKKEMAYMKPLAEMTGEDVIVPPLIMSPWTWAKQEKQRLAFIEAAKLARIKRAQKFDQQFARFRIKL